MLLFNKNTLIDLHYKFYNKNLGLFYFNLKHLNKIMNILCYHFKK